MSFDPNTGLAIINPPPMQTTAQQQTNWGAIAQAAALFGQAALGYFPGNRENNLAIAQANADAAAAQAQAAALAAQPKNNNTLYIVLAIVVIIIIALLMRKKA
jgi:hypothetical protein